jgi:hypothetical protein
VAIAAATKPIAILRIMMLTPFVLSTPSLSESNPAVPIELQRAAQSLGCPGFGIPALSAAVRLACHSNATALFLYRWKLSSTPLPVPGVGRVRWLVELLRCGAGESANFELEACDAGGRLVLPSELAYRSNPATQSPM